jgi:hypothetical protein
MIRKISFGAAIIAMVSLVSFIALAMTSGPAPNPQNVQIQRGAGALCQSSTEIKNVRGERSSGSSLTRPGVKVSWTVTRMSSNCPIKAFNVVADIVTFQGEKLTLRKTVRPGECCPSSGNNVPRLSQLLNVQSSTKLETTSGAQHRFIASDSKITVRVTPVF